jgi:hypothetical protein
MRNRLFVGQVVSQIEITQLDHLSAFPFSSLHRRFAVAHAPINPS